MRISVFKPSFFALIAVAASALSAQARLIDIVTYTPAVVPFQLLSTMPSSNQQLAVSPKSITATFTQNADANRSTMHLFDQYNNPVAIVPAATSGVTNILRVEIPGKLMQGTYRVEVAAICLCPENLVVNSTVYFSIY